MVLAVCGGKREMKRSGKLKQQQQESGRINGHRKDICTQHWWICYNHIIHDQVQTQIEQKYWSAVRMRRIYSCKMSLILKTVT